MWEGPRDACKGSPSTLCAALPLVNLNETKESIVVIYQKGRRPREPATGSALGEDAEDVGDAEFAIAILVEGVEQPADAATG